MTGRTHGALTALTPSYPNGANPADGKQYSDAYLVRIDLDATGLAVSNTVIDQWGGDLQDVGMQVGIDASSQKIVVAGSFDSGRDHGVSPAICTTDEVADAFVDSFAIGPGPGAAVDRWFVDGGHAALMQAVALEGGQAHFAGLSANAAPPVGGPPQPPGLPGCSDSFIVTVAIPP